MIEAIESKELKGINKATEQLHVASQYISMAGEFLAEKQNDGSHANMGWLSMKEKFISHPFGNKEQFVFELSPELMQLTLADIKNKSCSTLDLKGVMQDEGVVWIRQKLSENKIAGAKKYRIQLPYDLPDYANFKGKKFKKSPKKAFLGFSKLRTWAEYFVNKHKSEFEYASATRTWPHHFDHASYIPLEKNKSGEVIKSISLGLAIHDGMIDEPYFYISAWQKDKKLDLSKMKELSAGYWLNDGFKGAVFPVLDLVDDLTFEERIDSYFKEAIEQLLKLLKYKRRTANGK
jgi:hypothetical protein